MPFTAPSIHRDSPDDVVICCALRSATTKARKGGFANTLPEEILCGVLKAIISKSKINPKYIDDVQVGCVLPPGGGATVARMASLAAG